MLNELPKLVDYHCHLDLYPDFAEQFLECNRQRIATLAVTTTPAAWPRNRELAASLPYVRVALGLHPQLVSQRANELSLFEKYLTETKFVGEVGLDASPQHYSSYAAQKMIFERILQLCAKAGGKILSVHAVRSMGDVLELIERNLPSHRGRAVLHWFSGTRKEAARATGLGCYFSVNGEMLNSEPRRALVAALPLDRVLTETDGPFTTTSNLPSRPADVAVAVSMLAKVFGRDEEEIQRQIITNLELLESRC